MPGIVWTEMLLGLPAESDAIKIQNLLDAIDTIKEPRHLDYVESARIYRVCRSKGITIRSTIACLIAQLCLRDKLSLLSKDADFKQISRYFALQLAASEST